MARFASHVIFFQDINVGAPLVSIIIASFNRNESLCRAIGCWLQQSDPSYELIVVDQSREHDLATQAFLDKLSGRFRYFQLDHPNLPAARNFGVRVSRGDIILFCDDDMDVPPDVVAKVLKRYSSDPAISGISGVVFDLGDPAPAPVDVIANTQVFAGGFMSFRREVVERAGFFDEWLGTLEHGAGEDFEFTYRISSLGFRLVRDRSIVVCHLGNNLGGGCERLGIRRTSAKSDTSEADMFAGMYAFWKNRGKGVPGWIEAFWRSYHGYVLNRDLIMRRFHGVWGRHVRFWRVMCRLANRPWKRERASC